MYPATNRTLFACLILCLSMAVWSCGNRHVTKSASITDGTSHTEQSVTVAHNSDSTAVRQTEYVKTFGEEQAKQKSLDIQFYQPAGRVDSAKPVIIWWNDSTVSITPGNQAIKSVSGSVIDKNTRSASSKLNTKDSTHTSDTTSRNKKTVNDSHVNNNQTNSESNRSAWLGIPTWLLMLLLLIASAVGFWYCLPDREKTVIRNWLKQLK